MANLMEVAGSVIPIGTIIESVGPPDSTWLKCNGQILAQANYTGYVAEVDDLHPQKWHNWTWIDIDQGQTNQIKNGLDRMGSTVICVGVGNEIWRSTDDGDTWSIISGPSTSSHYCVVNNGTYFVSPAYGTSNVYYSSDGSTWNLAAIGASGNWRYMIHNNGKFIVFNNSYSTSPTYCYSSDGVTWYSNTAPHANLYCYALAGDGTTTLMYATDNDQNHLLFSTSDGVNWTSGTKTFSSASPDSSGDYVSGLYYLGGKWIMGWASQRYMHVFEGSNILDPDDWTPYVMPTQSMVTDFTFAAQRGMIYTGEHFIAGNSYTSDDGFMIGKDIFNLHYVRSCMSGIKEIISDGDNYAICLSVMYNNYAIGKSYGVDYDDTTYFQLPHAILNNSSGLYNYIKMSE